MADPRSRSLATALLRARFASGFRYVQLHHLPGHDLSSATFYKWKVKYSGLEVSDRRR
jgi:hypothetical protein